MQRRRGLAKNRLTHFLCEADDWQHLRIQLFNCYLVNYLLMILIYVLSQHYSVVANRLCCVFKKRESRSITANNVQCVKYMLLEIAIPCLNRTNVKTKNTNVTIVLTFWDVWTHTNRRTGM